MPRISHQPPTTLGSDLSKDQMHFLCCQVTRAHGCCCGAISLRTGVRLIAMSILLITVVSIAESLVLMEEEHHEMDHYEDHQDHHDKEQTEGHGRKAEDKNFDKQSAADKDLAGSKDSKESKDTKDSKDKAGGRAGGKAADKQSAPGTPTSNTAAKSGAGTQTATGKSAQQKPDSGAGSGVGPYDSKSTKRYAKGSAKGSAAASRKPGQGSGTKLLAKANKDESGEKPNGRWDDDKHAEHDEHDDDDEEEHNDEVDLVMMKVFAALMGMLGFCTCAVGCRSASTTEDSDSQLFSAEVFFWAILIMLVLSVLNTLTELVWVLEHAPEEMAGVALGGIFWAAWYVYAAYIALSYAKALQNNDPTMNGAVVELQSVQVISEPTAAQPTIQVLAQPVVGHIAQGVPSMGSSTPVGSKGRPQAAAPSWAVPVRGSPVGRPGSRNTLKGMNK